MNQPGVTTETGIIAWFASNHVAANLLMLMIIAFGVVSAFTIRKQTTPDFELNTIQVQVPYLGAAPQEVEEGVVIKIEEAIQDIDGIVEINSVAREGMGVVTAEVASGEEIGDILSEVKTRVDAISTFPGLTEKPVIFKQEVPIHVVFVSIYGDMDEYARKTLAQQVREELMTMPAVNQVQFLGDRNYEISIQVSEHVLRQYGLTMSEVSQAVRDSSVDLPGGVTLQGVPLPDSVRRRTRLPLHPPAAHDPRVRRSLLPASSLLPTSVNSSSPYVCWRWP